MRALRRLLGLDEGSDDARDTEAVRRIAAELDRLEPERARYLAAFAYVLARVAHADLEISDAERAHMEELVSREAGLAAGQAVLVVEIARMRQVSLGATENYVVTRQFRELSTREQRIELLRCLFGVAAADENISEVESNEITQIGQELGFTRSEVVALRAEYREHLAVLKPGGA